jgi:hypothetical protein
VKKGGRAALGKHSDSSVAIKSIEVLLTFRYHPSHPIALAPFSNGVYLTVASFRNKVGKLGTEGDRHTK